MDPTQGSSSRISKKIFNVTSKKQKYKQLQIEKIYKKLPTVLVNIFEMIVKFSVANESIIREAYMIFFELFKEVVSELNLNTIIEMNKLLVSKCKILMTYKKY